MTAMTLLMLLLAALIQVRGEPLAAGSVTGSAVLPLERAAGGDTPVLPLQTQRGQLRLLLDTGAATTMVTPELVRRLGLSSRALPPEAFALAGGGSDCADLRPRRSLLPDLELISNPGSTRVRLRGVEAVVLPVAALPAGVDGVLGAPTLRRQPIWIDPFGKRLAMGAAALRLSSLGSPGPLARRSALDATGSMAARRRPSPAERLQLRWHLGVPLLGLRTPLGEVAALADTGAEGVFVSLGLARRLPLSSQRQVLRLVGVCGEQPVEQAAVAGLGLTGIGETAKPPLEAAEQPISVILTDNPVFRVLGVEAIVGQELLRQRRQLWRLDLDPPQLTLH